MSILSVTSIASTGFFWMRRGWFVGIRSIEEFLFDIFHLEEYSFWFIVYRNNEEGRGFSDVGDDGFKRFSGVNWSVGSVRY